MIVYETCACHAGEIGGSDTGSVPARDAGAGPPPTYPDRLFLKALVIMIVRHLHTVHELLAVLAEPTPEMQALRALLTGDGRFPTRRTWERRLLPSRDPAGPDRVPGAGAGGLDPAMGDVWAGGGHRQHRAAGPRRGLAQAGSRGRRGAPHLHRHRGALDQVGLARLGLRLEAAPGHDRGGRLDSAGGRPDAPPTWPKRTGACVAAGAAGRGPLRAGRPPLPRPGHRRRLCPGRTDRGATRRGPYPHTDDGVEVRRLFHELRSRAIENFNEQFKGIFDAHGQVPTKGLVNTRRFALGAVFVYQLTLWYRHEHGLDLRVGLKPFLKAA